MNSWLMRHCWKRQDLRLLSLRKNKHGKIPQNRQMEVWYRLEPMDSDKVVVCSGAADRMGGEEEFPCDRAIDHMPCTIMHVDGGNT